ncbi:hypothetical protein J6590_013162 [Homalodisca vitripennis]|nr:hypothetical protein J6590_013162 [Homalodisca vitripennis]
MRRDMLTRCDRDNDTSSDVRLYCAAQTFIADDAEFDHFVDEELISISRKLELRLQQACGLANPTLGQVRGDEY